MEEKCEPVFENTQCNYLSRKLLLTAFWCSTEGRIIWGHSKVMSNCDRKLSTYKKKIITNSRLYPVQSNVQDSLLIAQGTFVLEPQFTVLGEVTFCHKFNE